MTAGAMERSRNRSSRTRSRLARVGIAGALVFGTPALLGCDGEDVQDVREGVEDADRQIDKLDSDGKDD